MTSGCSLDHWAPRLHPHGQTGSLSLSMGTWCVTLGFHQDDSLFFLRSISHNVSICWTFVLVRCDCLSVVSLSLHLGKQGDIEGIRYYETSWLIIWWESYFLLRFLKIQDQVKFIDFIFNNASSVLCNHLIIKSLKGFYSKIPNSLPKLTFLRMKL